MGCPQNPSYRRLLLLCLGSLFTLSLGVLPAPAQAQRMLTVGDVGPKGGGNFSFTLVSPNSDDTLDVSVPVAAGTRNTKKATDIRDMVNTNTNINKGWKANLVGTTLTFTFKGAPVVRIDNFKDRTDEKSTIASLDPGRYDFGLASDTGTAAGVDGAGAPSFVTIDTPLGTATANPSPGELVGAIIAELEAELLEQGNLILPIGPDTFAIIEDLSPSFVTLQNTDINLVTLAAATDIPEPAIWLFLAPALVGLVAWTRTKRYRSGVDYAAPKIS